MKIKRWAAAAMAALILVSLAACRGGRASDGGQAGGARPDTGQRTPDADGGPGVPDRGTVAASLPGDNKPPAAGQGGEATIQAVETEPAPTVSPEPTQQPPEPSPTEQPTEVAIEAKGGSAESLKGAWSQAYELPPGVPFSVTTTEAEIEAMIAEKMASSGYGSKISNLNVRLDNGLITVSFTLTISQQVGPKMIDISADGSVVFAASIDGSGHLALAVVSADFGKISVPPEMLAPLSEAISQSITGAAAGSEAGVTLTSLAIEDGLMTVKGYVTKSQ